MDGWIHRVSVEFRDFCQDSQLFPASRCLLGSTATSEVEASSLTLPHPQAELGVLERVSGTHSRRGQGGFRALGLHARGNHANISYDWYRTMEETGHGYSAFSLMTFIAS
uniref:Uncharacterized protein n=1 Tax=Lepeophtheirus salmonis TaxID=72036 RepID=A0A0K2V2F7_LEPSM